MDRQERIRETNHFELSCRANDVPGGYSVDCTFLYGFTPRRRSAKKHTCVLRPGCEAFDSFGRGDRVQLAHSERLLPQLGFQLDVPGAGRLEVYELPTLDSPWLRLRRVEVA